MSLETEQRVDYRTARKTVNGYFSLIAGDWANRQSAALWPTIQAAIQTEHSKGKTLNVREFINKLLLKCDLPEITDGLK